MTALKIAVGRTFRSLHNPNYRRYFVGQTVSMTGTWMQTIAQMWLVLRLSGSGVALGITTALQFAPILLFGMLGGIVADRFPKRKVLLVTQSAAAALAAGLGVAALAGVATLGMVYAFAFAWGLVIAVDNPTRQAFVAELVDPEDLPNAIGLNSTIITTARTAGPAIGGILITVAGVAACFLVNAASYLAVIWGLARMDESSLRPAAPAVRAPGQLRDGLRYVWDTPVLRSTLLLMAVVGTLAYNFRMLLPLLAENVFGGGAGTFGALSAMMGIGTLGGALISAHARRPTRRLLLGSALAFGALILVVAAAPTPGFGMAALVPMGAASIVFAATANATLQTKASPAMRGRVMALYAMVFLGSTPVGGPLVGWIAESFGTRAALALGGAATLLGATVALRRRLRHEATHALERARGRVVRPAWFPPGVGRGPYSMSRTFGARAPRRSGGAPLSHRGRRSRSTGTNRPR